MRQVLSFRQMLIINFLVLLIGFAAGWSGFLLCGNVSSLGKVVFVSKERIIELEQERIKGSDAKMFFGKTDVALKLIREIASGYADRRTKVLLVSHNTGNAAGGKSISEQVYREVIEKLGKDNEGKD